MTKEKIEIIKKLNAIAAERKQSLAQMALAWILKDKRITTVLIGASSVKQLDNNIDCLLNPEFSKEELLGIENVLKA